MDKNNVWSIDVNSKKLKHHSGLLLQVEGEMSDPDEIIPLFIPGSLTPVTMVRLIREGATLSRNYKMPEQTRPLLKLSECRA